MFCFVFEIYYTMLPHRCQPNFANKPGNFHRGKALFFVHPNKKSGYTSISLPRYSEYKIRSLTGRAVMSAIIRAYSSSCS